MGQRPAGLATAIAVFAIMAAIGGCSSQGDSEEARTVSAAEDSLRALTRAPWQLVEFQSMSDEVGTVRPEDPSLYTMTFTSDSTVALRLNCNRGTGTWSARPSSMTGGTIEFGPIAATRALCPPPSLDVQLARDLAFVRTYTIADGHLSLSLMADGGIYIWDPVPSSN